MGTNKSDRGSVPLLSTLADVDEEKVCNITEVCNVSREEALRVLDACHMDETMAIERFLSGSEISVWSEVSKKKKPAQRLAPRRYVRDRRDRNRIQRPLQHEKSTETTSPANGDKRDPRQLSQQKHLDGIITPITVGPTRQHISASNSHSVDLNGQTWSSEGRPPTHYEDAENDGKGGQTYQLPSSPSAVRERPESVQPTHLKAAGREVTNEASSVVRAWGLQEPSADATEPSKDQEPGTAFQQLVENPSRKHDVVHSGAVIPTFNYAAAAAAGTSHAKSPPSGVDISRSVSRRAATVKIPAVIDCVAGEATTQSAVDIADLENRPARLLRKGRAPEESELLDVSGSGSITSPSRLPIEQAASGESGVAPANKESQIESPRGIPNAWTTRPPGTSPEQECSEKQCGDSPGTVGVSSSAGVRTEESARDSLTLQFGSFGLSGLDGVNWSASEHKVHERVSSIGRAESVSTPTGAAIAVSVSENAKSRQAVQAVGSSTMASAASDMLGTNAVRPPFHAPAQACSSGPMSTSGATSGSGVFPILPVGPGGNFPPQSYAAPYLMPPIHGYTPALGSFENTGDLGSSRAPSIGPQGSLAPYDPTVLSVMASGGAKFAGIPGLGEMPGPPLVPNGTGKDDMHANSDVDKISTVGSSGNPGGMEPLAGPYVMPGYPSMQYPMYTFPNAPYAPPPGMQPPGPNPFPYPPSGQVSSQAARVGFGFEDNSVGLGATSRPGLGVGESIYTPGGYLSTSMAPTSSQKLATDAVYKHVRGNAHLGSAVGAMGIGMAGGIVHGMTYGDYSAAIPGISNGAGSNNGGPAGWNRQQSTGVRSDGSSTAVANQSPVNGTDNPPIYAAPGPGGGGTHGTHGGYWTTQQGGYYP